jgi:cation diffusion facilitator family transporter
MATPVGILIGSHTPKINRSAAAWIAVGAAVVTIAAKFAAYGLTGSSGLLSDAIESIANLVTSVTALITIWYASKPADRSHNYGHGKAEFVATGVEGLFIVAAAIGVFWLAIDHFFSPHAVESIGLGSAIAIGASAVNFVVGRLLVKVGEAHQSPALVADGKHIMTDVVTSLGVVAGLLLVWATDEPRIDSIVALLVALNILHTGYGLLRQTLDGFMDRALDPDEVQAIRAVIERDLENEGIAGLGFHALRTRGSGRDRFVDFHLLVPGKVSVEQAHDLADRLERSLRTQLKGVRATIHVEPIEDHSNPAAHTDEFTVSHSA